MRERQKPKETVKVKKEIHGTMRDSERLPATIEDSKRLAAYSWHWKRQWETAINNERLRKTCSNYMGSERQ